MTTQRIDNLDQPSRSVIFDDGLSATDTPDETNVVETDVLIVGSGPAGGSAALFLSTHGIDNIMITKYRWTANTPVRILLISAPWRFCVTQVLRIKC